MSGKTVGTVERKTRTLTKQMSATNAVKGYNKLLLINMGEK